jgi:hypothetical protein
LIKNIAITLIALLIIISWQGCRVKTEYLPQVNFPYVAEMNFFKDIKNVDGKAKTTRFKDGLVHSPFYFLLKVKEIENSGTVTVRIYEGNSQPASTKPPPHAGKQVEERIFNFGEEGKYYEYIIFFDQIDNLLPGKHRYAVFYNEKLIFEDSFNITENRGEK